MKQDIQAELNVFLRIRHFIEPEIRIREEILGVSPSGPGLRPDGLSQSALSQAEPLVPNAERRFATAQEALANCRPGETAHWPDGFLTMGTIPVNLKLRGRIA
jgi:hypothetical protein